MDTRTKLRKRTKSLKRKKLVVGLSLTTLGLGTISTIVPNLAGTVHAETLEQIGIDPTPLQNAVSAVLSARASQSIYTEESFSAFETALVTGDIQDSAHSSYYDAGIAALARDTYDPAFPGIGQTEFEIALDGINNALAQLALKETKDSTLEEAGIDTSELVSLLNQVVEARNNANAYTVESYSTFEAYLTEEVPSGYSNHYDFGSYLITATFDANNEQQVAVYKHLLNQAVFGLNHSLDALIKVETPTISYELPTYPGIELSNLRMLLDRYNSLNEDDYTPESWTIMHDNLNGVTHTIHTVGVATSIFNQTFPTENVTQELIDLMVSRGNAEMDELILKDIEPPQIVSGVLSTSSAEVKVGETVTFSYTLTFDDSTTQDAFEYYGYSPSYVYSRVNPSGGGTVEGSTWTPSEPGEYVFYPLAEPGSYATVTVKVVEATNDDGSNNTEKEADNDTNQDNKESDNGTVAVSNDNNTRNSSQTNNPESTDSTKTQEKESDKDNKKSAKTLPQTGEKSSLGLGIGGLVTMLFAVFTWFRRFRKN